MRVVWSGYIGLYIFRGWHVIPNERNFDLSGLLTRSADTKYQFYTEWHSWCSAMLLSDSCTEYHRSAIRYSAALFAMPEKT